RPAADGVPDRVEARACRRPAPRPERDDRLGRTESRLPLRLRAQRRLQARPRRQTGPAPPRRTAAHRLSLTESSGATAAAGNSWRSEARMRRRVAAGIIAMLHK